MKFVSSKPSPRKNKRYEIVFSEPKKTIHFGAKNGSTYIDRKDKIWPPGFPTLGETHPKPFPGCGFALTVRGGHECC